ncbi:CPSF A subunit region-domain-containing protein [Lactarius pseudohatsudake]|nr:CPSF A subunit region-domain-containing protein [Lactarius pseudohatsudake]
MRIVSTFHPPSSVTDVVKCRLTSDRSLIHLVVAKSNRLDIYSVQPSGLSYECGAEIWGRIVVVKAIPTRGGKSNLLLLTDHPDPRLIFITYSTFSTGGRLNAVKTLSLYHHNSRPSEFLHTVLVDPTGSVAVINCYTGKFRVVELESGFYKNDFDVMVSELNILSLTFLPTSSDNYSIAILHQDHNQSLQLLAHNIVLSEYELSPESTLLLPPTALSTSAVSPTDAPPCLVPVPPQRSNATEQLPGGVLVLGGRKVQFFELSSEEWQEKHREKQRKLESRQKSANQAKTKEKQKEREIKKRRPKSAVEWPWCEVTAWCPANDEGTKFFVGDSYGRLAMLSVESTVERGIIVIPLGEVSPPTALAYLDSQVLFIGSHFGDSQLIRIHTSPVSNLAAPTLPIPAGISVVEPSAFSYSSKGKRRASTTDREGGGRVLASNGTYIEVLDTWQNVGPILDAVLADTDRSGQSRIFTTSGSMNAGSLRIIQSGADFQITAVTENIGNYSKIWPLRSRFHDSYDTHILATNAQETVLFSLDQPDTLSVIPTEAMHFDVSPTLAASNIARRVKNNGRTSYEDSSFIVQVTEDKVLLLEYDSVLQTHSVLASWNPDEQGGEWAGRKIVAAALNPSQFVLGMSRKRLVVLNLSENNEFQIFRYKDLREEISVLSCTPLDPTKFFSVYIAVAYWSIHAVDILSVASADGYLNPVCDSISLPALPRSLLLHDFGYAPQILIGLRNGILVAYTFGKNVLEDERIFSLGTEPVGLTQFEMGEKRVVFASGSRAALLYAEKGITQHSSVLVKNVFASARINSPNWPTSLLLMTPAGGVIGTVRDYNKMHIRTVHLGLDNPRRLQHDVGLHAFAVACVRTEPGRVGEDGLSSSSLKLLDDKTFDVLCQFTCQNSEEITAIHMMPFSEGNSAICVGTVFLKPNEQEPSQGRLLLITVESGAVAGRQLKKTSEMNVNGCVYALTRVNGLLAASIGPSVSVYKVDAAGFQTVAQWNHNYLVTSLSARGSRLFVGDAICSVSVIDLIETEGGDVRLESIAKDFSPLWPMSIESLDQDTIIGANSDSNLFTYTVQRGETRTTLDRDGFYNLGDVVNKFIPGSMALGDPAASGGNNAIALEPKLLFFTSSGRIGVIVDAGPELSLHLTALERNLSKVVTEIANASHAKHRAPVGTWGKSDADAAAYGFLDGDFLEKFLDFEHPSSETERILKGSISPEKLKQTYAEIKQSLEALQALH